MGGSYERAAGDFLELASEQRLAILSSVQDKSVKISAIAKELDATVPEVYRNFERLVKADLIFKNSDGSYSITSLGKILYSQVSLVEFLSSNKKYFKNHSFDSLPSKYIQRLGSLQKGEPVKGMVKVLEKWKEIYDSADKYIYNILYEVPYNAELVEPLAKKVSTGTRVRTVFSDTAIVPKERKQIFERLGFKKMIEEGKIERKMAEGVKIIILLNEKQACVMFPTIDGEVDMSEAFFSDDKEFHEWCLDYFEHDWSRAGPFREAKLA